MSRHVLFIQGGGSEGTHDEWDTRLVDSLGRKLGSDYEIHYPRMPNEADPNYPRWSAAIRKELARWDDGTILVAHSIGATILINTLADEPIERTVRGIFLLAAPFVGEGGWPSEDIESMSGLGTRLPARAPIYIYIGTDDETVSLQHAELYQSAIPQAVVRRLEGRDHQLNNDLSEVAADILRLG
jgi:predicted alpha/beta hydrolase family esterase